MSWFIDIQQSQLIPKHMSSVAREVLYKWKIRKLIRSHVFELSSNSVTNLLYFYFTFYNDDSEMNTFFPKKKKIQKKIIILTNSIKNPPTHTHTHTMIGINLSNSVANWDRHTHRLCQSLTSALSARVFFFLCNICATKHHVLPWILTLQTIFQT